MKRQLTRKIFSLACVAGKVVVGGEDAARVSFDKALLGCPRIQWVCKNGRGVRKIGFRICYYISW
ncbi:MAG: hypothetical protein CMM01_24745 [Rhodopirellula sp.]|nr:hypothetical protein [Rhodopirellula sp.]